MNRRVLLESMVGLPLFAAATAPVPVWDPNGQVKRREEIFRLWRSVAAPNFDETGKQLPHTPGLGVDGYFRTATCFLQSEDTREKANGIILNNLAAKWRTDSRFYDVVATQILYLAGKYLSNEARGKLHDFLNRRLTETENQDIRFLGYNDNFPALDTVFNVLAGEILDRPKSRKQGMEGLERAAEMLQRRGMLTEYTAPTYTPVSLLCYADMAQYAKDKRAVALAAAIEQRLWLDVATHFHLPTSVMSGPRCRAYTVESVGHLYNSQILLYQVVGDRLWMTPAKYLYPSAAPKQVLHTSIVHTRLASIWLAASTYHIKPAIASILLNRPYPFRVSATSEYGSVKRPVSIRNGPPRSKLEPSQDILEYPAGELVTTTYMTEDYGVGSATAQFFTGDHTDTFFVNFRRKAPAKSLEDVSTIYCRYSGTNQRPGSMYYEPVPPERPMDYCTCDEGRVRAVQKDGAVLAVYQPKGEVVGDYDTLFLNIIMPLIYRDPRRILFGDKEVGSLPLDAEQPDIIFIEDEILFAAFRPLILTDHGRRSAVRILKQNGFLNISLYNYEGALRKFTREQLLETQNGFVAEISSRREGTFARFQDRVRSGSVRDEVTHSQRITRYERPGVRLDLCHSLHADGLRYALVNGELQPRPMFRATGVDQSLLRP